MKGLTLDIACDQIDLGNRITYKLSINSFIPSKASGTADLVFSKLGVLIEIEKVSKDSRVTSISSYVDKKEIQQLKNYDFKGNLPRMNCLTAIKQGALWKITVHNAFEPKAIADKIMTDEEYRSMIRSVIEAWETKERMAGNWNVFVSSWMKSEGNGVRRGGP